MLGLYIHIPFCLRRCIYCDFYVEALGVGPLSARFAELKEIRQPQYLAAIEKELCGLPEKFAPETIYMGGGTPTELNLTDFTKLLSRVRPFSSSSTEWTVECNPGTLFNEHIDAMQSVGVNRVSVGVQTFQKDGLEYLTRIHSVDAAHETIQRLKKAGFNNLNLDMIFAIPGTDLEYVKRDVEQFLAYAPEHISCYALDMHVDSGLSIMRRKGQVQELDEDEVVEQYEYIRSAFVDAGYHHYELFNYAKPGYEAVHNINAWQSGDYLGVGPSACSHWNNRRYKNVPNLHQYCEKILANESVVCEDEQLSPRAKAKEMFFVALRQVDGFELSWFEKKSGYSAAELYEDELDTLLGDALIEIKDDKIRLLPKAYLISNRVFERLV